MLFRRRRRGGDSNSLLQSPDPAEELRQKLAEARAVATSGEEHDDAETTVDVAEATGGDLEARRRAVHDAGRAAADEMQGD